MEPGNQARCVAFSGECRVASGPLREVAPQAKSAVDRGETVLIFDEDTGEPIEVDFRGTPESVLERLQAREPGPENSPRGPGRPRLGVVAREVTLLPRHWEWLNSQSGGASVALRKLVEQASRANAGQDRQRRAREAAYRFMSAMAGNLPGFEEACRAFFAADPERFRDLTGSWPTDIRDQSRRMAEASFPEA